MVLSHSGTIRKSICRAVTTHGPDEVPEATVDDVRGREATRARELAAGGFAWVRCRTLA